MVLAAYLNWSHTVIDNVYDLIANLFGCAIGIINFTIVPIILLYLVYLPKEALLKSKTFTKMFEDRLSSGRSSITTTMGEEKQFNVFMRCREPALQ